MLSRKPTAQRPRAPCRPRCGTTARTSSSACADSRTDPDYSDRRQSPERSAQVQGPSRAGRSRHRNNPRIGVIPEGVNRADMTEVSDQGRDAGIDVLAPAIRVDESVHRKGVAKIMQTRRPACRLGSETALSGERPEDPPGHLEIEPAPLLPDEKGT